MTSDKTELMQLHQRIAELEAQLHERNRFVQHLEQQQVRYRTMLQALPDTVFLLHPEGRVLDYYVTNDDTWLQLGEHVIGQPIQQLLPDWLADLTLQSLHQARDTGSHTVQYTLSRADQCFSFEARSVLVNDHEVLVIVRDITDQQHVRIALEQSEERFRLVFEHTPIGMCITNEQGLFEYVNPAYCQLYAYAPDELIGQPFTIVVPEGQRDVLWELHRQFITGETEEIGSDWQVVNRHGACLTILADAARIMGHDGRPRKATFVRNITEERATRERLTLMDAAVHYSTECILITDNGIDFPGPRIVFVNPAFTRLTGYQPEEVIGKTPRMLQGARTDRTMLQQLRQSLEQGQPFGAETTNYRKDGSEYVVEWRISPIRNASGEVTNWVSVQRDRTEQKQAEQELQLAKVSAEAANRSKSMFLAQMSHELRTPLNAILGFVQLLLRDKRLSADQHEHLDIIGRSGEHLLDLINQVLEISKIEAGRMTLNEVGFDLHRMLNWLEEMFQVRAQQKGLSLNLRRAESVPQYVYGDESKLRQVLINLLGNAIKFTETGSITLRVTAQDTYRPQGTTDDAAIPVRLWFQVRDTGRGIAPDELDLLFKAFSQTRTGQTSMEGSGLGLTISREFVRLMRGDILITSEVDIGTTVTFDIPLAVTDASLVKPAEQPVRVIGLQPGQPTYRMLVVDDRWENRKMLARLLQMVGFDVREATQGSEAIDIWRTWRPHMIWMDMRMPVMDGYTATRQIKASPQGKTTVIIALTASAFEHERSRMLAAGCDDMIAKPFREATIFDKIQHYLRVRFLYEHLNHDTVASSHPAEDIFHPESLSTLSTEQIKQLYDAADRLDTRMVQRVIDDIQATQPALADALATAVRNYRFDIILEWIEQ